MAVFNVSICIPHNTVVFHVTHLGSFLWQEAGRKQDGIAEGKEVVNIWLCKPRQEDVPLPDGAAHVINKYAQCHPCMWFLPAKLALYLAGYHESSGNPNLAEKLKILPPQDKRQGFTVAELNSILVNNMVTCQGPGYG